MQDQGWDRFFALCLLAAGILVAASFPDYGIGRDEPRHLEYGARALAWYFPFGTDGSVLEPADGPPYGALHAGLLALLARLLPFDGFETAHLTGGLLGLLAAAGCHRLAAEFAGRRAGALAALLLLATPAWWQHSFNNPTDIPFAVAAIWSLLFLTRLGRELPAPSWPSLLFYGVTLGAALTLNPGASGTAFGTLAVAALAWGSQLHGWRQRGRMLARFLPALALAVTILLLTWPRALLDPQRLPAAIAAPLMIDGAGVPLWSLPAVIAMRLPEPFLLALLGAAGLAIAAVVRGRGRLDGTVLGAAILVPMFLPSAAGQPEAPALLLMPPMAAAGGIALDRAAAALSAPMQKLAAVALLFYGALHGWTMVRLHPYQGIYVNQLAGSAGDAVARLALDPEGSAMSEAARELTQQLIAREGPTVLARRLRIELCGPPAAALYYLPVRWRGQVEATADFSIAHVQAKCPAPQNGREFLRVERAGQVLALVRDLRVAPATVPPSRAQSEGPNPER